MILTIILFLMVAFSMGSLWYYMYRFRQGERRTDEEETSLDAAIHTDETFQNVLRQFPDIEKLARVRYGAVCSETYVIPGLNATKSILTKTGGLHTCTTMTPQGLAVTEDYLLISAYCHDHVHHSVIYMIDKKSHTFLKEIILPDQTHAGGLAYDPIHRMVWVSGYQYKRAYANAYRLEDIQAYRPDRTKAPLPYTYEVPLKELKRNSFMTYHDGALYVGYFALKEESIFVRYPIRENGSLALSGERETALISNEVQGIAFYGEDLIVYKSYGMNPSKVLVMKRREITNGVYDFRDKNAAAVYTLPDRLESICYADGKVYLLFESAATAYRHRTYGAIDRVVAMEMEG